MIALVATMIALVATMIALIATMIALVATNRLSLYGSSLEGGHKPASYHISSLTVHTCKGKTFCPLKISTKPMRCVGAVVAIP